MYRERRRKYFFFCFFAVEWKGSPRLVRNVSENSFGMALEEQVAGSSVSRLRFLLCCVSIHPGFHSSFGSPFFLPRVFCRRERGERAHSCAADGALQHGRHPNQLEGSGRYDASTKVFF